MCTCCSSFKTYVWIIYVILVMLQCFTRDNLITSFMFFSAKIDHSVQINFQFNIIFLVVMFCLWFFTCWFLHLFLFILVGQHYDNYFLLVFLLLQDFNNAVGWRRRGRRRRRRRRRSGRTRTFFRRNLSHNTCRFQYVDVTVANACFWTTKSVCTNKFSFGRLGRLGRLGRM